MDTSERIHRYQLLESEYLDYSLDDQLNRLGFFTAPASTKYHGAYEGGLFDHSLCVCEELIDLTNKLGLKWRRPESPFIVGMFHDLCKCDQYRREVDMETGEEYYAHKSKLLLDGHGDKSVMILSTLLKNGLTEEEMLCIRYHMGAYEVNDWNSYDRAIKRYATVLWTHTADMVASKVVGT